AVLGAESGILFKTAYDVVRNLFLFICLVFIFKVSRFFGLFFFYSSVFFLRLGFFLGLCFFILLVLGRRSLFGMGSVVYLDVSVAVYKAFELFFRGFFIAE